VRLTVPAIGFFICCFLPLALAQQIRRPSLALAIGQFMLFRRPALEAIGGYESVRAEVVDDVALARRIVRLGHRWRIMDGTNRVSCRMYRGFWEAVEGFTKNIFAYFNHHVLLYILVWTWVEVAFALPPLVLLAGELGRPLEFFPQRQALIATSASLLCWLIAYRRFRFPLVLVVLYPITITLFVLIAFRSMVYNLTGQAQWKDRALSPPLWRW
jgi:chlorobactene glucosyltransferase